MNKLDEFLFRAKSVANAAGKKTGEIVEISKLKLQIVQLNGDIDKSYHRIGQLVHQQYKAGVNNQAAIEASIAEIDALMAQVNQLNTKVNESQCQAICHNCGGINSLDAVFCSRCGVTLSYTDKAPKDTASAPVDYVVVDIKEEDKSEDIIKY